MNWTAHVAESRNISSDDEARRGSTMDEMEEEIMLLNKQLSSVKASVEKQIANLSNQVAMLMQIDEIPY